MLRAAEVAELLGISQSKVRALTAQPGGLPHFRLGSHTVRYLESDLNKWLAAQSKPAAASAPVVRPAPGRITTPAPVAPAPEKQWCPTTGRRRPVDLT